MKREKIRIVILVALTAVFFTSVGMIIRQQIQYRKIVADSEEAQWIAGIQKDMSARQPVSGERMPFAETSVGTLQEEALDLAGIDLESLRAVNEDVAGWIALPGTTLSYPLLQGDDNQFYLFHNWKGEAASGGSVFLESVCNPDLAGFHTIVYAHRMRNDTMFGILKYYKSPDFWQEHPRIYVVLDDKIYCYDIFSAQEAGVEEIVFRLDIEENHLEEEFLQYCTEASVISTGIVPKAENRILTLSTCADNSREKRWVIHCVLAQEYDRKMH